MCQPGSGYARALAPCHPPFFPLLWVSYEQFFPSPSSPVPHPGKKVGPWEGHLLILPVTGWRTLRKSFLQQAEAPFFRPDWCFHFLFIRSFGLKLIVGSGWIAPYETTSPLELWHITQIVSGQVPNLLCTFTYIQFLAILQIHKSTKFTNTQIN